METSRGVNNFDGFLSCISSGMDYDIIIYIVYIVPLVGEYLTRFEELIIN